MKSDANEMFDHLQKGEKTLQLTERFNDEE